MRTVQVVGVPDPATSFADADAVVVSLKSRTIPAAEAVDQSLRSAEALLGAGARQLFFKYCSTFDSTDEGNIGPVTDALMAHVGASVAIACPAFPANGRTVYRGYLFVGGRLLSESPMKDHPLTPMRDPDLVRVLQRQTPRPVFLVGHDVVARGSEAIGAALAAQLGIAIVDALGEGDLHAIGKAAAGCRLVTGGSGVAIGLPANFRETGLLGTDVGAATVSAPPGRAVILSGSCSQQTRRQVAHALEAGLPAFRFDAVAVAQREVDAARIADFVTGCDPAATPLVYSSADPDEVAAAQARLGRERAGALVEETLGEAARLLAGRGVTRFLVAGGETSGAVVGALGIAAFDIGPEIDPGVPWVATRGRKPALAMALKSGNFGGDDFFTRAWTHLA
jgi:uncharacterized protein YgbK (DUF1537 family)